MYTMLMEEIEWAVEEKEPYEFTHYLILSKTYSEVASKLDEEENRPQKKKKQKDAQLVTMYFHPEDEALHRHAIAFGDYDYTKQGLDGSSDSKRAFQELGVKPQGHLTLLDKAKFADAVKAVGTYLSSTS